MESGDVGIEQTAERCGEREEKSKKDGAFTDKFDEIASPPTVAERRDQNKEETNRYDIEDDRDVGEEAGGGGDEGEHDFI